MNCIHMHSAQDVIRISIPIVDIKLIVSYVTHTAILYWTISGDKESNTDLLAGLQALINSVSLL